MIRTVLACSAAALALGLAAIPASAQAPAAAPAAAATDGSLNVHLRGLTPNKGQVIVMLFDSDANFDAGKSIQSSKIDATGMSADVNFTGIAPGRYAVKVFYDINSNGQYDQGTDYIGFSNHVDMTTTNHVPTFSETSFFIKAGANTQQITVARLRS